MQYSNIHNSRIIYGLVDRDGQFCVEKKEKLYKYMFFKISKITALETKMFNFMNILYSP